MDGLTMLNDFLTKSVGGLPTGEPGLGAGTEVESAKDGGKLAGVGKQTGAADSCSGPAIGAPSCASQKLSDDDEDTDKQMSEHKKPIETSGGKVQKSHYARYQGRDSQQQTAQINAQVVSRLRCGPRDMVAGVGLRRPDSTALNAEAAGPPRATISQAHLCKSCGEHHPAMYTACPQCGSGATAFAPLPGVVLGGSTMVLEKSYDAPGLRPAPQEPDYYIPRRFDSEGDE